MLRLLRDTMRWQWIAKNALMALLFMVLCYIIWYEFASNGSGIKPSAKQGPPLDLVKDRPPKQGGAEEPQYTVTITSMNTDPDSTNEESVDESLGKVGVIEMVSDPSTSTASQMNTQADTSINGVEGDESGEINGVIEMVPDPSTSATSQMTTRVDTTNNVVDEDGEGESGEINGVIEAQYQDSTTPEPQTPTTNKPEESQSQQEENQSIEPMENERKTTKNVMESATSLDTVKQAGPATLGALKYHNGSEKQHVVFLKVHKCGSSTVQNIFLRFGFHRNLSFVLGHDDKSIAETQYVNVISYKQSITENNIVPAPNGRHFDILCCHVIYNREQFHRFLPNDAVYIGIVREPVKRLESAIHYFNLFPGVHLSEFAASPLQHDTRFPSMANNRMGFEYGFPRECFPPVPPLEDFENVQEKMLAHIRELDREFSFIIINERMDESLVYMKRMLRWQLKDILYATLLGGAKSDHRRFNDHDATLLRNYLYIDFALYDFAVKRFEEAVAKESDDFQDEVKHFQETNRIVSEFCNSNDGRPLVIEASSWNDRFFVTIEDCKLYTLFEMTFIQRIRMQQYGRVNN